MDAVETEEDSEEDLEVVEEEIEGVEEVEEEMVDLLADKALSLEAGLVWE